jgi:hypothetical protein
MPKKKSEVEAPANISPPIPVPDESQPPAFIALIKSKQVACGVSKEALQKALMKLAPKKLAQISIYTYIPAKVQVAVEW